MTIILNQGTPSLTLQKQLRAKINCPNCQQLLDLDAHTVDVGHVIQCGACNKNTYYPFERPWYRRRRLILGYVLSLLTSFLLGLLVNYAYDRMSSGRDQASVTPSSEGN
jgi:hypothetical protein